MTRRSRILTNLLLSLPLATSLLCAAPHAGAQTSASFTVPFAFSANNQEVPSGSYNVQLQDRFLYLRSLKTTKTVILMVRPDDSARMTDTGRLVFQRYGRRNYLKQVSQVRAEDKPAAGRLCERPAAAGTPLLQAIHIQFPSRIRRRCQVLPGRDVDLPIGHDRRAELDAEPWHIRGVRSAAVKLRAQIIGIVGAQRRPGRCAACLQRPSRVDHPENSIRRSIR